VKVRSMITVGAAAGALFFGSASAANAGTNSGSCTTTHNGGTSVLPVADPTGQLPNVYGQQTGTTSGDAGVDGSGGFLEVGGSSSGGYISGDNNGAIGPAPASGLNGTVNVSATPSVCVGVAGVGGVQVP